MSTSFARNIATSQAQSMGKPQAVSVVVEFQISYHQALLFNAPIYDDSGYIRDGSSGRGTYRLPRPAYVADFNGTNNYALSASRLTSGSPTTLSGCAWIKTTDANGRIFSEFKTASSQFIFDIQSDKLRFYCTSDGTGTTTRIAISSASVNDGNWHHVAFSFNGSGDALLFIDGVEDVATETGSATSIYNGTAMFCIGDAETVGNYFDGRISDVRIYSDVKTEGDFASIAAGDQNNPNVTNLLGAWSCEEESDSQLFDWSGNDNTLTIAGTLTGVHATDTGKTWSYVDSQGFSPDGAVVVPIVIGTTNDSQGDPATYTGRTPYPALSYTNTLTGNGSNVYVDCGSPLFPATADFEIEFWYYPRLASPVLHGIAATSVINTTGRFHIKHINTNHLSLSLPSGGAAEVNSLGSLVINSWNRCVIFRAGSIFGLSLNGGDVATYVDSTAISQVSTYMLNVVGLYNSTGSIANFQITTGSVTKTIVPEGTGQRVWVMGSDNTAAEAATAIQGTLTSVHGTAALATEDWLLKYGGRLLSGRYIPAKTDGTGADTVDPDSTGGALLPGRKIDFTGGVASAFSQSISLESNYEHGTDRSSVSPIDTKRKRSIGTLEDHFAAAPTAIPDSPAFTD